MICVGAKQLYEHRLDTIANKPFPDIVLPAGVFWVGYISYDAGLSLQGLQVPEKRLWSGPAISFFEPEHIITPLGDGEMGIELLSEDAALVLEEIRAFKSPESENSTSYEWEDLLPKNAYKGAFDSLKGHLYAGNLYEANLCRALQLNGGNGNAATVLKWFEAITEASPMPFQFAVHGPEGWLAGSSPERFLKRASGWLLTQPIKGTARRGVTKAEDDDLRDAMVTDEKTRAENMMITDLARNDLARIAEAGTVTVPELMKPYTFARVHQLISSVQAKERMGITLHEVLVATFPMGSMTGAPKMRAMEVISETEPVARGLFSGIVGYVLPSGDFDFGVVIRSVYGSGAGVYTASGGAIVWDSELDEEWEEVKLKLDSLLGALKG
jgi:para-aminobenzoate synthetase component I